MLFVIWWGVADVIYVLGLFSFLLSLQSSCRAVGGSLKQLSLGVAAPSVCTKPLRFCIGQGCGGFIPARRAMQAGGIAVDCGLVAMMKLCFQDRVAAGRLVAFAVLTSTALTNKVRSCERSEATI